jgi:hypothetical protein
MKGSRLEVNSVGEMMNAEEKQESESRSQKKRKSEECGLRPYPSGF